ncbi:MAG: NAD(P)-dependent oxidoreductase, partial [Candidatus Binatia bacterium]
ADTPAWPAFRWCKLEALLAEADVVSLHCPLLPETRGLINTTTLARMKPAALLLNTARGALVVDQDLADALNQSRLAGAALDVLSLEPPPPDNPLLQAKNCLVTPHMAWATKEARARLMDVAVSNVAAFLTGRAQNVVG